MAAILPGRPGMIPEGWEQAQAIFLAALEQPREEREEFARNLCGGNEALWITVSRLLTGHDAPSDLLATCNPAGPVEEEGITAPPFAGPYRLLEKIGAGGMGTVYRAERADGQFEKQVAVKLMAGIATNARLTSRFVAERQILAKLDHAHIARLLDGGVTEDGRPYIVMERVDGVRIDRYCLERNLSVGETVRLFVKACEAVAYANEHSVIHRDLKPGNLLITPDGTPKLLDFGISKLLDAPDTGMTFERGQALTPDYASPEQLMGHPATTASDVYSLGVMLYELLWGERPDRLAAEPARRKVRRGMNRDLEAILARALAQDPARRYRSAQELREDLERYLKSMPVAARPRALVPRIGKFVLRHRWQMATVAVLAATATSLFVLAAYTRRKNAQRRTQTIAAVIALFREAESRMAAVPQSTDARRLLFQSMREELQELERDSGDNPDVLYEIALGYCHLGRVEAGYKNAVGDYDAALETFQRARGFAVAAEKKSGSIRDRQMLVYVYQAIAMNALGANHLPAVEAAVADGLELLTRSKHQFQRGGLGEFVREYRISFALLRGHALQAEGRYADSLRVWLDAERETEALPASEDLKVPYVKLYVASEVKLRLAEYYCWSGAPAQGLAYAGRALPIAKRYSAASKDPAEERAVEIAEATCHYRMNQPEEALRILQPLHQMYARELAFQPHNYYLRSRMVYCDRYLGDALLRNGSLAEAERIYTEGLGLLQSPEEFAGTAQAQRQSSQINAGLGDLEALKSKRGGSSRSESAAHQTAACGYYAKSAAVLRSRRSGVLYIEDRATAAEVEGALAGCPAGR